MGNEKKGRHMKKEMFLILNRVLYLDYTLNQDHEKRSRLKHGSKMKVFCLK